MSDRLLLLLEWSINWAMHRNRKNCCICLTFKLHGSWQSIAENNYKQQFCNANLRIESSLRCSIIGHEMKANKKANTGRNDKNH